MKNKSENTVPNILITGANGQLGSSIATLADSSDARFFFTDVAELDITDAKAVDAYITEHKIDILINCAAYTNVDKAEDDEKTAELLNAKAPAILAKACKKHKVFMIHISTDYVFGGGRRTIPYKESDPAKPTGVYGVTKLQGEKNVELALDEAVSAGKHPGYLIFRTAWLYSEYGKNFVKTMLSLMADRQELNVVFDQVGTPTYAGDLARVVYDSALKAANGEITAKECGVYNFTDEGVCSWYDFSVAIEELSREKRGKFCNVRPCHSDEFPSKVCRPSYSVLDKSKVKKTFGADVPYWRVSLRKCLDNLLG